MAPNQRSYSALVFSDRIQRSTNVLLYGRSGSRASGSDHRDHRCWHVVRM